MPTARSSRLRVAGAAATVFLLAAPSAPGTAVAQAGTGPTCFGKAATIVGSRGAPRVVGTAGPDDDPDFLRDLDRKWRRRKPKPEDPDPSSS